MCSSERSTKERKLDSVIQDVASIDGVLDKLKIIRQTLPPTALRIADFILNNANDVVHMSVTEVADKTKASEGSIVNLCRLVGMRGFQQIKLAIARDLVQPVQFIHEDIAQEDSISAVTDKVFHSGMQALQDTLRTLDNQQMERAIAEIIRARRIEIYGIGSAAPVAEDANYRLVRIGFDSKVITDSHIQAVSASLTGPEVVTITISHSGSTHETISATRFAKEAGATCICITNYGKSPLLAYADIVLNTMARETQFRTEAMTSRIAQLAIIDALIAGLALATYPRSVEALKKSSEILSSKRF